jgi:dienelactone hydrolase
VVEWSKDLRRSLDYIETRPDLDRSRIAFSGFSWGAALGANLIAVERRFKACVLTSGGFYLQHSLPEVDSINFAPHVTVPVLMLNGLYDFDYPV